MSQWSQHMTLLYVDDIYLTSLSSYGIVNNHHHIRYDYSALHCRLQAHVLCLEVILKKKKLFKLQVWTHNLGHIADGALPTARHTHFTEIPLVFAGSRYLCLSRAFENQNAYWELEQDLNVQCPLKWTIQSEYTIFAALRFSTPLKSAVSSTSK